MWDCETIDRCFIKNKYLLRIFTLMEKQFNTAYMWGEKSNFFCMKTVTLNGRGIFFFSKVGHV